MRSLSKVTGRPFVPAASATPVIFEALNKLPALSSLMVATPVAATLPVVVAIKLKVSPLSQIVSFVMVVRTNKVVPAVEICMKSPAL